MKKFIRTPRALLLGVSALAVVLVGAGVASGTIGAKKPNIYWGCVPKDGRIKLVYPGSKCNKGERFIKWHQSGFESATVVKDGQQGLTGDTGAQGPAGSAGAQGPAGPQGLAGPKGDAGAPGAKGADGAAGPQGEKGADGANGVNGEAGAPGEPGAPGAPGAPGEKGEPGTPGAPGEKGDPGTPGAPGTPGTPGAKGEKGEPGEKGERGEKGEPGTPGAPGDKGDKGDPGASGVANVTVRTQSGGLEELITANCAVNETAVGGGVESSQVGRQVTVSRPNVSTGKPTGWVGQVAGNGSHAVTVYALCAL